MEVAWPTQADDDVREAALAPPAQVEPQRPLRFPEDRGEHEARCPLGHCGLSTWHCLWQVWQETEGRET